MSQHPSELEAEAPFPYPKINWDEWPHELDDTPHDPFAPFPANGTHNRVQQPPEPAPAPLAAPLPAPLAAPAFPPRDEGEMNLYALHGLLQSAQADLAPLLPEARERLAVTLRYLEEKDATRAELVRRCLHMAGYLVDEAAALLNEGIHWPTVEGFHGPPEETFLDTPHNWLAVGRARIASTFTAPAAIVPAAAPASAPEPAPEPPGAAENAPAMPPALAALVQSGLPPLSPTRQQAARRSLGNALRSERTTEQARFYAIARNYGLPTGPEAAPAIRAALAALFGTPIESRKALSARQWSQAASAIETEDLWWQAQPIEPGAPMLPGLKASPRRAAPACQP